MKVFTAILVVTCLGLAAFPSRGEAQDTYDAGLLERFLYSNAPPRAWGSAEYLLAFRKSRQVPALVTTSSTLADQGVLGAPSTTVLFGGGGMDENPSSGVRAEAGIWLDPSTTRGIGVSFTGLARESIGFSAQSDGSELIARPIYNTLLDVQASQLVSYPGLVAGNVDVQTTNDVYSAEVFLRQEIDPLAPLAPVTPGALYALGPGRWDFLVGYQYSRVNDFVGVSNHLVSLDPAFLGQIGTTLDAFDSFRARNEFHGLTLGLRCLADFGPWSLSMTGKVGLGDMHQSVDINGGTVVTVPHGPTATSVGGLLAQPSNIGNHDQDRFGVIPEARFVLNYNFSPRLSVGVGYDFIYWNSIAYAGDQINTRVDVTQTNPAPAFVFRERDSFVHAVTFLVQLNN